MSPASIYKKSEINSGSIHSNLSNSNQQILDIFLLCFSFLICFQTLILCFPFQNSAIFVKMKTKIKTSSYLIVISFIFHLSILFLFLHVIQEGSIKDGQQRDQQRNQQRDEFILGYLKAHDFVFQLGQYCGLQGLLFLGQSRDILSRRLLWGFGFFSLGIWLCFSFFATLVQPFEFPFREQDLGRLDLIWIIYFHIVLFFMMVGFTFGFTVSLNADGFTSSSKNRNEKRIFSVSFMVFLFIPFCLSLLFQVIPFTTISLVLRKIIVSLLNSISFLTFCVVLIFKVDEKVIESDSLQMPYSLGDRIVVRWLKSKRPLKRDSMQLGDNARPLEESWRPSDWYSSEATRAREWTSKNISSVNLITSLK